MAREDRLPETVGSHYRIVSRSGMGGMGVVYKAVDSRLNRAVAIKVIHDQRLRDAGERLRSEALAAASIDHPYICKVYEIFEDGDDVYLVMEFVEGETLSAILRRGVPPLGQTVEISSEIVEGLAEAHARGLVHRDVKPSNVMITPSGHVKLLDFGLAREDVAATPTERTRTSPSERSAYAGTPQYMAPEQAAGSPVTARADLFSVGVIMFECLSGRLPFAGTSPYDYVRHLLSDDPRPLDRLAPAAPADLVRLVMRCLEKVPADRPASAAEILEELQRIGGSLTATGFSFNSAGAERSKRRWQLAAAAVTVAAVAFVGWFSVQSRVPDPPLRQSRPVITWPSEEHDSHISSDGQWLSFISTRSGAAQLFVQPIDGTEARAVTLAAGVPMSHVWSPDGRDIAAILLQGSGAVVQTVPAFFGGTARESVPLNSKPSSARALRWIGRSVYLQVDDRGRSLLRVDLDRAVVENVSAAWTLDGSLRDLDVHPDGRRVVLSISKDRQEDLWVANLDGSSLRRITNDAFFERRPIWNGTAGTIVYQSNRGGQVDLWEIFPETGRTLALTSSQTEEVPGDVSPDGTVITFNQESDDARLWVWDTAARTGRQLTADALSDLAPSLSAGGRVIAFQRSQPSPSLGYLILDSKLIVGTIEGGVLATSRPEADGFAGLISPNGEWLAFLQRGATASETTVQVKQLATDETIQLSTTGRLLTFSNMPADWADRAMAWSPAGDDLFFVEQPGPPRQVISRFRASARGATAPVVTGEPNDLLRDPYVSPNGRRLAYLAYRPSTLAFTLRVRELDSDGDRAWTTVDGPYTSTFARGWLADGRFVLTRLVALRDDRSADIEILVVGPEGAVRRLGPITHAYPVTARLDRQAGSLHITRAIDGVHNLFEVPLATGVPVRLSDNALPGVTFSGAVNAGPGLLVGVRNERRRDVWVIETRPSDKAGPAGRSP